MFGTVYKPKITVHGQWTLLDACTEEKKKKKTQKMQRKKRNTQTPPKSWEWSLTFLKSYHQKQTS